MCSGEGEGSLLLVGGESGGSEFGDPLADEKGVGILLALFVCGQGGGGFNKSVKTGHRRAFLDRGIRGIVRVHQGGETREKVSADSENVALKRRLIGRYTGGGNSRAAEDG